jgi:hypothetical protein
MVTEGTVVKTGQCWPLLIEKKLELGPSTGQAAQDLTPAGKDPSVLRRPDHCRSNRELGHFSSGQENCQRTPVDCTRSLAADGRQDQYKQDILSYIESRPAEPGRPPSAEPLSLLQLSPFRHLARKKRRQLQVQFFRSLPSAG